MRDGGEIMVSKSTVVNKTFFALMVRILQELQAVSRYKLDPTNTL